MKSNDSSMLLKFIVLLFIIQYNLLQLIVKKRLNTVVTAHIMQFNVKS